MFWVFLVLLLCFIPGLRSQYVSDHNSSWAQQFATLLNHVHVADTVLTGPSDSTEEFMLYTVLYPPPLFLQLQMLKFPEIKKESGKYVCVPAMRNLDSRCHLLACLGVLSVLLQLTYDVRFSRQYVTILCTVKPYIPFGSYQLSRGICCHHLHS